MDYPEITCSVDRLVRQRLGTGRQGTPLPMATRTSILNPMLKMHPNMAWNNAHWVWVHTIAKSAE